MAQEEVTKIESEKDSVFDEILQGLRKTQQLASKHEEILQKYQKDKEDEQQANKDNSKILKKLPTVLTPNERKRYQQIGKRFMVGAEQQFQQMKKGIKLKQMMKTSKDYFLKGFDKVRQDSKKNGQKKSFWKLLLGGLIVIGLAAALFSGKISKMIPNLTEMMGGLFEKIKSFLKNMLRACWQFMGESVGGSISSIFKRIFTESIPNILKVFFFDTLPNAIFNTYLAVMSQFDPRANALLSDHDESVAQDIDQTTDEQLSGGTSSGQRKSVDQLAIISQLRKIVEKGQQATVGEIQLLRRYGGRYLLYQNEADTMYEGQGLLFKQMVADMLDFDIDSDDGGIKMLQDAVSRGDIRMQYLLDRWLKSNRTADDLRAILEDMGLKVGQLNNDERTRYINYNSRFENLARALQNIYNSPQIKHATLKTQGRELTQEEQENRLGNMYNGLGYIALNVLKDDLVSTVNSFLTAANNFVNSGDFVNSLKINVNRLVENLGSFFNNFFIGSLNILKNVLHGIMFYTDEEIREGHERGNRGTQTSSEVNNALAAAGRNGKFQGIVVNVDMTGNQALQLSNLITHLQDIQGSIVNELSLSVTRLQQVNGVLGSIGELHALSQSALKTVQQQIATLTTTNKQEHVQLIAGIAENAQSINSIINGKTSKPPIAPDRVTVRQSLF